VGIRPASRFLRAALRANAVFCVLSGLAFAAAGAGWFLLLLLGVSVAGFGLVVAAVAAMPADRLRRAAVVIAADMLWVAANVILLTLLPLPAAGAVAVGMVAAIVAVFATWQMAGLAAIRRDDPLAASP
jgi:hypothetical protein